MLLLCSTLLSSIVPNSPLLYCAILSSPLASPLASSLASPLLYPTLPYPTLRYATLRYATLRYAALRYSTRHFLAVSCQESSTQAGSPSSGCGLQGVRARGNLHAKGSKRPLGLRFRVSGLGFGHKLPTSTLWRQICSRLFFDVAHMPAVPRLRGEHGAKLRGEPAGALQLGLC